VHRLGNRISARYLSLAVVVCALLTIPLATRQTSRLIDSTSGRTGLTVIGRSTNSVQFAFTNMEECAARIEIHVVVQGDDGKWRQGSIQPAGTTIVRRRRAITLDVPEPPEGSPWRLVVKAHSHPTLAERMQAKAAGRAIPPLLGAWASNPLTPALSPR
jgi:hypothetical protein